MSKQFMTRAADCAILKQVYRGWVVLKVTVGFLTFYSAILGPWEATYCQSLGLSREVTDLTPYRRMK